ncbi:MAG TPA: BMP family ABC transporter substrate-binding protein [Bacillus bacterium]|uniref:BMP family ABC transporter substrate-binding protein n=1 Tax=Siminovitchia fordii TaxID=254759 RepID=UPI00038000C6|nr:BMP family ABC transporter substrate-binding protein [Siminovitchia fordii]HBZ09653.1 BMP family ABC transporter substrate-binding protein [Bacillus sp. (in: firmicutes)]
MGKMSNSTLLISIFVSIMLILAACGGNKSSGDKGGGNGDGDGKSGGKLSVGYYVNATLGDKSFFDSVKRGVDKAEKELGYEVKTIEGGTNQGDWHAGIESMVSSGKYDVILVGTSQTVEMVDELAQKYPDQKFIFFDDVVDQPNVYSMTYSQSEGSFLAGAFAGLVTINEELEGANPEKVIGFVGGMDIPIINDFKSGYEQGAHYVDKDIKVVSSIIGNFADAPKAKELTLSQINSQKADVVYQVAAAAGLGVLEAANEKGVYSIGVDSNQNDIHPGSVLTSMMKNLDSSTFRALELFQGGELPFGTHEELGVKEEGVGLAQDDLYNEHVPQSIRDQMEDITKKLADGEIEVKSTLK